MQTGLLGLGIAIILALVTALVGPLLIDWRGHRGLFETEAARLIGLDVRVNGEIEVRLLPSPRLTLRDIEIGGGKDSASSEKVGARSLGIELALGPLMRGDWRANELHLVGAEIRLGIDATGHIQAPKLAVDFNPDALTIDRLSIEDGAAVLTDAASGSSVTLTKISFNGEARSLLGPIKGDGAASIGDNVFPFRLAVGRLGDDDSLRIHLNIDPVRRPLSIEIDGNLTLAGAVPQFDGTWSVRRPVGIDKNAAAASTQSITQPWLLSGKIKATTQSALMEQIEFQYGAEDRAIKLTGVGSLNFGKQMRLDGVVSGRQIDLDRAISPSDALVLAPIDALRALLDAGGGVLDASFPIQIGVGIDQITLGGNNIQNFRGDIRNDATGWNLDRFEFRAPGYTQVRLDGHLQADGDAFTGPFKIDSTDPLAMTAWLQGRKESDSSNLQPLNLQGDLSFSRTEVAIEQLKMDFDRRPIAGRVAYVFASGQSAAKLDVALNAPELDVDALAKFGNAMLAGSAIDRPGDMTAAVEIGRATIAGFKARNVSARVKVGANGLQIDRLVVADLGGAAFSASGRIVTEPPSPSGHIDVDLAAPDMAPVLAVLERMAPDAAQFFSPSMMTMAPAKLHARMTVDGVAASTLAKFDIDGTLNKLRIALNGDVSFDPLTLQSNDVRLEGKLQSDEGRDLTAALGLGGVVAVGSGPGILSIKAGGPVRGEMRVNAVLNASGLNASLGGLLRILGGTAATVLPSGVLRATVAQANAGPLAGVSSSGELPVDLASQVTVTGKSLGFSDITGHVAGSSVRGKIDLTLAPQRRIDGVLETDRVDAVALIASAIALPAPLKSNDGGWVWPAAPFGSGAFADMTGQIAMKFTRVDLLSGVNAQGLSATLRIGKDELALDDIDGEVAGGKFTGALSVRTVDGRLQSHAKFSLSGADAAGLFPSKGNPPLAGKLDAAIGMDGAGMSAAAFVGSLHGSGNLSIVDGRLAGLNPGAFDNVIRAVDGGLAIDTAHISDLTTRSLDGGTLDIKRVQGDFVIGSGQIRLVKASVDADARLALSGMVDLVEGTVNARLILSGDNLAAGARPDIFMTLRGPLSAPVRNIDVSALNAWLSLRAVENQTSKLRAIEKNGASIGGSPPAVSIGPQR